MIATVVYRATSGAVCAAFVEAMREYGVPAEVLSDNGKQFTGRFGKPRPSPTNGCRCNLTPHQPSCGTSVVDRLR